MSRRKPARNHQHIETTIPRHRCRSLSLENQTKKSCEADLRLAERILIMAEEYAAHRRSVEMQMVKGNSLRASCGLFYGFVLAICALGASTYVIILGHDLAGASLFGGTLVSIVSSFVYGTRARGLE